MSDARHPKQYPRGPKQQVTPAWKARVLQTLTANARFGRSPASLAELAREVGADKGGLHTMLHGEQTTSKFSDRICQVLHIDPPMISNPEITEDEWDRAVSYMRGLPREQQEQALSILKTFMKQS